MNFPQFWKKNWEGSQSSCSKVLCTQMWLSRVHHMGVGEITPTQSRAIIMNLKLIKPLKRLSKDEVQKLGEILSVPQGFLKRQYPFPGFCLAVHILGDVTEGDALETICLVDLIFINSIKDARLYYSIWKAFTFFFTVKTIALQGDRRTHSYGVAMRGITSEDGLTADWEPNSNWRTINLWIGNACTVGNLEVGEVTGGRRIQGSYS